MYHFITELYVIERKKSTLGEHSLSFHRKMTAENRLKKASIQKRAIAVFISGFSKINLHSLQLLAAFMNENNNFYRAAVT